MVTLKNRLRNGRGTGGPRLGQKGGCFFIQKELRTDPSGPMLFIVGGLFRSPYLFNDPNQYTATDWPDR
jgi:hypothetical protein